jgi:hypothetical protein
VAAIERVSWAVSKIKVDGLNPHEPIQLRIHSADEDAGVLEEKVYRLAY